MISSELKLYWYYGMHKPCDRIPIRAHLALRVGYRRSSVALAEADDAEEHKRRQGRAACDVWQSFYVRTRRLSVVEVYARVYEASALEMQQPQHVQHV